MPSALYSRYPQDPAKRPDGPPLYAKGVIRQLLCPQLYNRLNNLFAGSIKIANRGEAFNADVFRDWRGKQRVRVIYPGEVYRVCCPYCGDTRNRLWVNHMFGQRGPNGFPMKFLAHCFNEGCFGNWERRQKLYDDIYGFRNVNQRDQPAFDVYPGEYINPTLQISELPGSCTPITALPEAHPAVDYMIRQRRYTREMLDRYSISYCLAAYGRNRMATGRIVFPIYMYDELVGWQCRYIGTANWKETPKYYSMPGMSKTQVLYNFDIAARQSHVVVVEGPTDANIVGDSAVAILGKTISSQQTRLLQQNWDGKPLVLLLDADAKEESLTAIEDLREWWAADIVSLDLPESYDPADYGREAVWNFIHAEAARQGVILRRYFLGKL